MVRLQPVTRGQQNAVDQSSETMYVCIPDNMSVVQDI